MAQHLQGWLQALAHIGAAVNRGLSLSELLDLIAKTACKLMSYDFCAITIPDAASHVLVIEGSYGLSADYIREVNATHPIRLHGFHTPTPSGQAFAMGVPVQVEDFGSNPAMLAWRAAARDQGFSSMISVPLNSADETLGTLNCYTRSTHHFTKEEESRLLMLADQAAVAITTSRLRSEQAKRITALNELNESLEEQYELQRQAEAIHERLTALTLEGGGVGALGGALAEILDRPVAVCETNGTILYNTKRDGVSLPAALLENAAGLPLPHVLSAGNAGLLADVHLPDTTGTRTVVRVPVIIKEKVVAWIWTSGKVSELRPLDRQAMERAAAPLALELLRTRTATQAEWRETGEILSELLSGKGHGSTALLAQAARLGHDLSFPHAVIAVRFEPHNESALPYWLPPRSHGWHDESRQSRCSDLTRATLLLSGRWGQRRRSTKCEASAMKSGGFLQNAPRARIARTLPSRDRSQALLTILRRLRRPAEPLSWRPCRRLPRDPGVERSGINWASASAPGCIRPEPLCGRRAWPVTC